MGFLRYPAKKNDCGGQAISLPHQIQEWRNIPYAFQTTAISMHKIVKGETIVLEEQLGLYLFYQSLYSCYYHTKEMFQTILSQAKVVPFWRNCNP